MMIFARTGCPVLSVTGRYIFHQSLLPRRRLLHGKFGQPTPWTHPHLLKEGEVNVGIKKEEFKLRREKLVEKILKSCRFSGSGLIILPSARKKYMVDHIPYFFRQDTDFRYLTGCLQPQSILAIEFNETSHSSYLLLRENTAYEEKWEGQRFGFSEATEFFDVGDTYSISSLQDLLSRFGKRRSKLNLWYDFLEARDTDTHETVVNFISEIGGHNLNNVNPLREVIHELRCVKSASEVELMRTSCQIGAQGLKKTIAASRNLKTELDYLATIDYHTRIQGAGHLAYPPVVAAGNNANTIHYVSATDSVREGDMMLIDSGCEYHGYSSDITRTWPVSGEFSPAQSVLYDVVLECQEYLIKSILPYETHIDRLYREMQSQLAKGLIAAGVLPCQDEASALRFVHVYCPHNVSHHLGMDVHDCATVSKSQALLPGNVITVEPGLYIKKDDARAPPEFRGQGIRIEDDILITESGCEVLSRGCPKSRSEIETLVKNG